MLLLMIDHRGILILYLFCFSCTNQKVSLKINYKDFFCGLPYNIVVSKGAEQFAEIKTL